MQASQGCRSRAVIRLCLAGFSSGLRTVDIQVSISYRHTPPRSALPLTRHNEAGNVTVIEHVFCILLLFLCIDMRDKGWKYTRDNSVPASL